MKKISYIIMAFMAGILFYSCENDLLEQVVIDANPSASELLSPSGVDGLLYTINDADKNIEFTWTASDFGFDASISYSVQVALTDDFTNSVDLFTTYELSGSLKVSDLNNIFTGQGLSSTDKTTIKCRVKSSVSAEVDPSYSDLTNYDVRTYQTVIDYPVVYVPGAYQGWSPGAETGRLYSYNFDDIYEGIIRLNGDDPAPFKITINANWDGPNYGGVLVASGDDYSGTLDDTAGDFFAAIGTYEYTVDMANLTIDLVKTDDWGIIGSSVAPFDWSEDIDMFYNGQIKMWEITGDFVAGVLKFRANDAWDLNYGDTDADGSIEVGGTDIELAEDGNYTIRLDIENATYIVLKN